VTIQKTVIMRNSSRFLIIFLILLGDFNAKLGREDSVKPTTGNNNLHHDSNDNSVQIIHFAIFKNLVVKSTMFLHQNIHKYSWTSPDGKIHNQIDHILY